VIHVNSKATLVGILTSILITSTALGEDKHTCSLLLKPPFSAWADSELVLQSKKNLVYLESIPYAFTDLHVNNRIVIRGLPKAGAEARFAPRVLESTEALKLEFRHYTTPEGFEKIQTRKRLVAGPVPYVNSPYVYPDVTGVFLTTKDFKAEAVGLDSKIHSKWIDFHLPEGTAVVWLEPGIYVIPGTGPVPEWILNSAKTKTEATPQSLKISILGYSPTEIPILPLPR